MNILWTKWLYRWKFNHSERIKQQMKEREGYQLVLEIRKAYIQWQAAEQNFHEITGKDQVDYAIYAINSAEKRYENLIKAAKTGQIELSKKNIMFF